MIFDATQVEEGLTIVYTNGIIGTSTRPTWIGHIGITHVNRMNRAVGLHPEVPFIAAV